MISVLVASFPGCVGFRFALWTYRFCHSRAVFITALNAAAFTAWLLFIDLHEGAEEVFVN